MKTIVALLDIGSVQKEYRQEYYEAKEAMQDLWDKYAEIWFLTDNWEFQFGNWTRVNHLDRYHCLCKDPRKKSWLERMVFKPKHFQSETIKHFLNQGYVDTRLVRVETILFLDSSQETRRAILTLNSPNVRVFSSLKDLADAMDKPLEEMIEGRGLVVHPRLKEQQAQTREEAG